MRGHLLLAALLGLALPAAAQVRQSGTITPGHVATWTTTGVVQDGGTAATPSASSFGLLGAGTPLCIADSTVSGPYHQLCFGANSSGGGVLSYNAVGGATTLPFNFLINGVVTSFSSLVSGSVVANNTVVSNISGGTAAAVGNSLTSVLDATLGSTPGSVVYRAAGGWAVLGPGSNGACLTYVSAGPAVAWGSCAGAGGTGTVTSLATNNGLTGGTITTSGTIGLAAISNNNVLANTSGGSGVPGGVSVVSVLDSALGSTRGSVAERGSGGWVALAPSSGTGLALVSNGAGADPSYQVPALRGYLGGCVMSNDGGNPNTVIDTAACQATSDDAAIAMVLAAFTKSTGAWAVGTGNGCLDTGAVGNSTWYHLYVIERVDTGVVDQLCSISATAPTMPASYTKKRRIGSFKTNGSAQIYAFTQLGDQFIWGSAQIEASGLTVSIAPATITLGGVPAGVSVLALTRGYASAGTAWFFLLYSTFETDNISGNWSLVGAANALSGGQFSVTTNTSGQVKVVSSAISVGLFMATYGWVDTRGRFN